MDSNGQVSLFHNLVVHFAQTLPDRYSTQEDLVSSTANTGGQQTPETTLEFNPEANIIIKASAWGDPGGQPVIFAHGGGQTRHSWGGTAKALATLGWYAVAYDHRGHGESSWCPDGNYDLKDFADDLEHIAGTFERAPVLVGASLGGV